MGKLCVCVEGCVRGRGGGVRPTTIVQLVTFTESVNVCNYIAVKHEKKLEEFWSGRN